jgi:hypothetical protein
MGRWLGESHKFGHSDAAEVIEEMANLGESENLTAHGASSES